MNVRKTSADVIPESARQNSPAKTAQSPKAPPSPATARPLPAAPSRAASVAGSQWLAPTDKLSAAIVSFARFFSLPLKPELTAAIRRQAFASMVAQPQPDHAKAAATEAAPQAAANRREALCLAAAASLGKGVELSPRGLEAYAAAIDPEWFAFPGRHGSGGQGRRQKRHGEQARDARASPAGVHAGQKPADDSITASDLREAALEAESRDPLLATLNRLPGKDGRRWIVLPFAFGKDGREFRVSMRVLLEGEGRASRMVLDIAEGGPESGAPPWHWLFSAEWQGGALAGLSVFVQPAQSPKAQERLALDLSRLADIPAGRVSVGDYSGSFPCESPRADELLHSVDEAV